MGGKVMISELIVVAPIVAGVVDNQAGIGFNLQRDICHDVY